MLFPLRAMSENLLKTLPKGADLLASDPTPPDEDEEFCISFHLVVDCHYERSICLLHCDRDVVICDIVVSCEFETGMNLILFQFS